jgi:mannose/fructose/N-acetylgalactosamine-specific phosphotransferase system component IID
MIMAFGIAFLFLIVLLLIVDVNAGLAAAPTILGLFLFFVILGLVIAAAIQFFSKGGLTTEFAVTPEGVGYRAGKESELINRATLAGTVLGGSLAGAGGSIVNITREMDFMRWDEVRSITVYPKEKSLVFSRRSLIFPFVLYCTPENFERVKALARKYAPGARLREKRW